MLEEQGCASCSFRLTFASVHPFQALVPRLPGLDNRSPSKSLPRCHPCRRVPSHQDGNLHQNNKTTKQQNQCLNPTWRPCSWNTSSDFMVSLPTSSMIGIRSSLPTSGADFWILWASMPTVHRRFIPKRTARWSVSILSRNITFVSTATISKPTGPHSSHWPNSATTIPDIRRPLYLPSSLTTGSI